MRRLCWFGLVCLLLLGASAQVSQAGYWVYMNGSPGPYSSDVANHLYVADYGDWFYLQPASTSNVYDMREGGWWKIEHSFIRVGWSYWKLPWIYCAYANRWYWMDLTKANWAYDYLFSEWTRIGTGDLNLID